MSRDQDRRNEFAAEQGFDSYSQYQTAYREVRDAFGDRDIVLDPDQIRSSLEYEQSFDTSEQHSQSELQRDYEDLFGIAWDEDESAFWEWVRISYGGD